MRRIATIVGGTGAQGGSVVQALLKNGSWTVRAITRNPDGDAAKKLSSQGVEIIGGDINKKEDLTKAFTGTNVVFANTVSRFDKEGLEAEEASGKLMVDVAKEQNVEHFIYSSEENANALSKGALVIPMLTVKANIEEYLFKSGVPSSAVQMPTYMENFREYMKPQPNAEGVYEWSSQISADSKFPMVSVSELGQVVLKLFENRDQFLGKKLFVAGDYVTPNEIVSVLSKVWNIPVKFKYLDPAEFRKRPFPSAGILADMSIFWDKYGHAGEKIEGSKRDVFEAKKICPTLSTLQQWVEKNMPSPPPKSEAHYAH